MLTQDLIEDLGPELTPLVTGLAQAVGEAMFAQTARAQGEESARQIAEFKSQLTAVQSRLDRTTFLGDVTRLAGHDAKIVFDDKGETFSQEFMAWKDKQSEGVKRLAEIPGPAAAAAVVKAYAESLVMERNKKVDATIASEKKRIEDIHKHTMRGGPRGGEGNKKNDDDIFATNFRQGLEQPAQGRRRIA